jgi:hypothetical protein
MGCPGLHCDGCGNGGSVLPALGAGALVLLAASGAATVLVHVLVLIAIAIGATVVLVTAGVITWMVRQTRQDGLRAPISARPRSSIPPGTRPGLSGTYNRPIAGPREIHHHVHLPAGLTAAELAAALHRIDHEE